VNGILYAVNVVLSVLGSKVSRWGILYQRRFDVSSERVHYPLKQGYESSHTMAANAVRSNSEVLDLACGPGGVAGLLKSKGCHVTGVDLEQADDSSFDKFIQHDLNSDYLPQEVGTYDTILLLDAIEHFARPERFMELLRDKCYAERTNIIITTPNIAVLPMRISLLLGQFNYGPRGILDLTHTRLFTFRSLKRMLREEGYEVLRVQGIPAPFPEAVSNGMLGRTLLEINRFMIALWPSMFAYQIFVEARFRPPLANLLELSMRRGNAVVPDISAAE
jgi:2-polyprenyl-3-methyl-5-hydroxy-6-metoxy-1,4-benzoquinol methylase